MKPENSIRKQKLTVNLDSESDAMLLRARLPDINRDKLLPVIERVLEEMSVPGRRITIDRLTIDLGILPFNRFAEEAEQRLDVVLRRRLQDIVTEAKSNVAATNLEPEVFSEPVQHSRLRLLEHYLINGVLPWHAHNKGSFSCEALFLALAEEQKDSVVDVIVKHYRLPQVIERLVLQLRNDSLRKLLYLLEPHNADVILAYILDLGVTHTLNPVLPINAGDFERLVWLLTLTYSMRDRGTQFNRRSYLKSLIHDMAQSEGLKYWELVNALHQGLKKIMKNRPLKSTLPALIATLAGEKNFVDKKSSSFADAVDNEFPLDDPLPHRDNAHASSAPQLVDGLAIEWASALFQRYDKLDLLRYYLEHGTLSHRHTRSDPTPSPTEVVAFLPRFPPLWVTAIFDFKDKHRQATAIFRAVELLPETELLLLLKKLFPMDEGNGGHFYSSVRTVAQQAKNKTLYYSNLLSALLNNQSLDLEQFAGLEDEAILIPQPDQNNTNNQTNSDFTENSWQIKTRFLFTLRELTSQEVAGAEPEPAFDESNPAAEKSAMALLRTLIADYPVDTRHFLLDIQTTPDLADKAFAPFLEKISYTEFEHVLRLAQPDIFNVSKALAVLLASIPVPYRPGTRKLRSVILAEALCFKRPTSEDFFTRVLRALFPTPLSKPLAEHLFASAESWQKDASLTEEQIEGFTAAINHCLSDDPAGQNRNRHAMLADEQKDKQTEWQNRVFSTLLPAQILRLSKHLELKNLTAISREGLPGAINQLLARSPEKFSLFVREHIVHQPVREYWIDILPESSLVRFIWLLEPQQLRALLNSAETLACARRETAGGRDGDRRELWLFLLEFFAGHSGGNCTLSAMTTAFFDHFTVERQISGGSIEGRKEPLIKVEPRDLLEKTRQLASANGENQLLAVLHESRQALLATKEEQKKHAGERRELRKATRPAAPTHPRFKDKNDSTRNEDCLYIDNAGLVLIGVFLPHLFKSLDMLHSSTEGKIRLRDKAVFSRGVHMLQYLVNGSSSTPEPLLPLNKILCGESVHATIEPDIELTKEKLRMCEQLHKAVLSNWASLSSTSIKGLQETFLQREGRLVQMDDGWKLTVQRKTVDVLKDQISWGISVISHPWMPETLYVTW